MDFTCKICNTDLQLNECQKYVSKCIFTSKNLYRYKCPNCGVIFGNIDMINMPKATISIEHDNIYKQYNDGDSQESELRTLISLNPKKKKTYLDYGCGRNDDLINELNKEGFNVYGYDAFTNLKSNKITNNKEDLKNVKFDGIFSHNVLEHMQNPVEEFKFMNSLLKDDGKMAHATPCYLYLYEYTIFHLYFFVDNSIEYLTKNSGFSVVDKQIDGEFINYIYSKSQ